MTILENSFVYCLLAGLWQRFFVLWDGCATHALCQRIGLWVRRKAQESVICDTVWREGALSRRWKTSLTRALADWVLNLPCALVKWLHGALGGVWEGSFFLRTLTAWGGSAFFFLGLFMLAMLVAPHSLWNNAYGFLGALAVTAMYLLGCAAKPRRTLQVDVFGPYMIFYLLCIFNALSCSLATSLSIRFFLFHAAAFLLALLAVNAVEKLEDLRIAIALAVFGITVAAVYGCYQGYVGVEVVASLQDMALNKGMPGRVYSLFDNANNFAELLVMLIPLDIGLLFSSKTWKGRFACLVALVPCVISIGQTYSRSGWIGLALAMCVFIALTNWRLVPPLIVLGVAAIPFLPTTIYNRILTIGNTKDSSTQYRFAIYEAVGTLMKDYWFKGVGLGTDALKKAFDAYPTMFDGNHPIHAHNNYLQMWVETGIIGFLAYLAMLAYTVKSGVKAFYASADKRLRYVLSAAIASLCGILVISLAEYTWFYPRNMFTYWFLLGIIMACVKLGRKEQPAA